MTTEVIKRHLSDRVEAKVERIIQPVLDPRPLYQMLREDAALIVKRIQAAITDIAEEDEAIEKRKAKRSKEKA